VRTTTVEGVNLPAVLLLHDSVTPSALTVKM
jgi:hypothetical protein